MQSFGGFRNERYHSLSGVFAGIIDIHFLHPYDLRKSISIVLVDDHAVVRPGLRMFLALDPELHIVGEVSNGAEGIEQILKLRPDVVLMDLVMPDFRQCAD
jgi:PleD family two-component response regulator